VITLRYVFIVSPLGHSAIAVAFKSKFVWLVKRLQNKEKLDFDRARTLDYPI
jgi:hypothetical protein